MIKVIFDTSVWISALKSKSDTSSPVLAVKSFFQGSFSLVMTPQLREELVEKLLTRTNMKEAFIENLITYLNINSVLYPGDYSTEKLNDIDPDDNKFLAAAYESSSDYLVSLDGKHLLPMKYFHGTHILQPSLFLRRIKITDGESSMLKALSQLMKLKISENL